MGRFISVATFGNDVEAHLAQATLAAAGIESFLKSDDAVGMLQFRQYTRGIQLLVDEEKFEEAKTLLTSPAVEDDTP